MSNKLKMKKILKEQKVNLLKYKSIDSPLFFIKGEDKKVLNTLLQPYWQTPDEKALAMLKVRRFCEKVKAREVVMISDSYTHPLEDGGKIGTSDAICVSVETRDQMELVILPYTKHLNGKISFGKEYWEIKTEKFPVLGTCEGLVQ